MTEDIDMAASPAYTQVAHRVLDTLEGLELTGRTDWLAIPLPAAGRRQRLTDMASAAKAEVALQKRTSASAAFLGELGGGKSYAMKCAVYWTLAAGRKKDQ
jgi:hypothetical protein